MGVMVIVIAVAVVLAAVLTLLHVQNRRRARLLAGLDEGDRTTGPRAAAEADAARSTAEGWSRAAHQGISGAGGMGPGA